MMTKKHFLILITLLFPVGLILSSCHLVQNSTPSVLVIAVDHLGVNELNCNSESMAGQHSGIAQLCQDSIRFTHAFTTSPLSGPALASILTGMYPFQHGLRSNVKSFLPSRVTTLAEVAQQKNYATSFFSGGAPLLRKLNLHQGFETFDDTFNPSPTQLFRPFSRNMHIFEEWLSEIKTLNFFTVFYVPDLAYTKTATQNDIGESRPLSFESQVEEFDETLSSLIKILKEQDRWNNTLIILTGLQGPDLNSRNSELPNLNLYSEKTQIGLLIKPAQKPRDLGINWSFDPNVTLADVGATLAEIFEAPLRESIFPVLSLSEILRSPSAKLALDRPVITESAWASADSVRFAARWGQYLYLLDANPRVYNSLIDRQETSAIKVSDSGQQDEWEVIQKKILSIQTQPWTGVATEERLKWSGFAELFSQNPTADKTASFEKLAHRLYDDSEISGLYSQELLANQNWKELEKWAQGLKWKDLEIVAARNLKKEIRGKFTDPCLALMDLQEAQTSDLRKCEDPLALSLFDWLSTERSESADSSVKENSRKKFLRSYLNFRLDRQIVETFYELQGVWDLNPQIRSKSLIVELMLALPEAQKLRSLAHKAFQQIQQD